MTASEARSPIAEIRQVLERAAYSPGVIVLGIFLLASLDYALTYPVGYGESQTLVYAKQFADPSWLPGDWYMNLYQPVRIPYQLLIYPLVRTLPLADVSLLARLFGYLSFAAGIGLVASRLRIHAVHVWIAIGTWLWLDQALLPGREWILRRAESKVIAYALIVFALHALMQRRVRLAGFLGGLATTMHVMVGFWASFAIGLTVLSERIGSWGGRLAAAATWLVGAAGAIYFVLHRSGEAAAPAGFDVDWVWNQFRNPHYNNVAAWHWDEPATIGLLLLLIATLLAVSKFFPGSADHRIVARFALWTLVPLSAAVLAVPTPLASEVAFYFPFRVADTIVPLLGLLFLVPIAMHQVVRRRARPFVAALLLGTVAWIAGQGLLKGYDQRKHFPKGGLHGSYSNTAALHESCDWVRQYTPAGALILSSPDIDMVNYLCERPVLATFRNIPSAGADIAEWYQRLVDLNGGVEPSSRGYAASREIDHNFARLSDEAYIDLGRKYGARYLLVQNRRGCHLPRLFQNDYWSIYLLAAPEGAAEPDSTMSAPETLRPEGTGEN